MADLGTDTVRHFADTFGELVTGQMRETVGATEGVDAVEHYLQVIQEKTGVLIASAATWAIAQRSHGTPRCAVPVRPTWSGADRR